VCAQAIGQLLERSEHRSCKQLTLQQQAKVPKHSPQFSQEARWSWPMTFDVVRKILTTQSNHI